MTYFFLTVMLYIIYVYVYDIYHIYMYVYDLCHILEHILSSIKYYVLMVKTTDAENLAFP